MRFGLFEQSNNSDEEETMDDQRDYAEEAWVKAEVEREGLEELAAERNQALHEQLREDAQVAKEYELEMIGDRVLPEGAFEQDRPAQLEWMVEHLYDLDRKELRRLAYEALLISDGPDRIEGSVDYSAIVVIDRGRGEFGIWQVDGRSHGQFVWWDKEKK